MSNKESNTKAGNSVVIIGGGVGGLFTGALLAKHGYSVTILEKNKNIGGGLQTFVRNGHEFETGMHILGGFQKGGNLNKLCSYLGIMDKLDIEYDDDSCIDRITYLHDGRELVIPRGREAFTEYLCKEFPESAGEIRAYVDLIYNITDEVDYFHMREETEFYTNRSENFFKPIDEVISGVIGNEDLRNILAFINPMYGGVKGRTPTYIHAIISVLYIEGQSKFRGGSRQLTEALVGVIEANGGTVKGGEKVTRVHLSGAKEITNVVTETGNTYTAEVFISSIHPARLLAKMPASAFPKAYSHRVESIPNSNSAFQAFFILKENTFKYQKGAHFVIDDYADIWKQLEPNDDQWPRAMLLFTPSDKERAGGEYCRKLVVNCAMSFDEVLAWQDSKTGHRPQEYKEWKESRLAKIVNKLKQIYPDIEECIEEVYTSSPLTIRDYYDIPNGALYGFSKNASNILLSQLTVYTRIKNLLLTGQCVNLHGICGVPLTAIMTAEALVGRNSIIREINAFNNN